MPLFILSLLSWTAPATAADYYPAHYRDSIARFEKLAAAYPHAERAAFPIPNAAEPNLAIHTLHLPAREAAGDLVVVTSGVHGMEAFAGSAIQQMLLAEILPKIDRARTGVMLIHALNPHGFQNLRRVNEENVDLNRNFPADPNLYAMENADYEKIDGLLNPQTAVKHPRREAFAKSVKLLFGVWTRKYSTKQLGDAIGRGQHHSATGIGYGGTAPTLPVRLLRDLIPRVSAPYRRIVFVDIHTGLGSANQLHLITGDGVRYGSNAFLQRILKPAEDGDHYDLATADDPGFYPTPGDVIDFLPKLVAPGKESVAFTAEFGTLGAGTVNGLRTVNRLILENQGHHHGYRSSSARTEVETDFRELFFPADPEWRRAVLEKSRFLFSKIFARLKTF